MSEGTLTKPLEQRLLQLQPELIQHRNKIKKYTSSEINRIADKLGFLKICLSLVVQIMGDKFRHKKKYEEGFKMFAQGIQLLDDLTDLEEDLDAGNMSLPHTLGYMSPSGKQAVQAKYILHLTDRDQRLLHLVRTQSILKTLKIASSSFSRAMAILTRGLNKNSSGEVSRKYISNLKSTCDDVEHLVGIIGENIELDVRALQIPSLSNSRREMIHRKIRRHLSDTRRALFIGADGS